MKTQKGLVSSGSNLVALVETPVFEATAEGLQDAVESLGIEEVVGLVNSQLFTRTKNRVRDFVNLEEPPAATLEELRKEILRTDEAWAAKVKAVTEDPSQMIEVFNALGDEAKARWRLWHARQVGEMREAALAFDAGKAVEGVNESHTRMVIQ